jgi:hypothetical protein
MPPQTFLMCQRAKARLFVTGTVTPSMMMLAVIFASPQTYDRAVYFGFALKSTVCKVHSTGPCSLEDVVVFRVSSLISRREDESG